MEYRGSIFLFSCIVLAQLLQESLCIPPADPETRARMEEQAMSSIALKQLEEMVEADDRARSAPKSPLIIVPKPKNPDGFYEAGDQYEQKAYIIHKKSKKVGKKPEFVKPQYKYEEARYGGGGVLSHDPPQYRFDGIKYDDDVPAWFDGPELDSAGSSPSHSFYESIVEKVMNGQKSRFGMEDPFAGLEFAASDDIPSYKPRFDYRSYARDSTDTKLNGKNYWKDAPERREEKVDDKGCRMVVKKIMDPEEEKKSGSGAPVKSVIITKECEYPSIEGPDARIPEIQRQFQPDNSRLDSEPSTGHQSYERESAPRYKDTAADSETDKPQAREPLEPDYIDRMLEAHFKSFPSFSNPITSFRGYQERFNLRTPQGYKEVKPKVGVHTYEYSHPESGFEAAPRSPVSSPKADDAPRTYDHKYHYEYPVKTDAKISSSVPKDDPPRTFDHKYHYEYPDKTDANVQESGSNSDDAPRTYDHHYHYDYPEKSDDKATKYDEDTAEGKSSGQKDPKMVKKTFAYYRKDNPKDDPNDQQYAEEYAQGNYRSFSSDYDSERDGPKKQ